MSPGTRSKPAQRAALFALFIECFFRLPFFFQFLFVFANALLDQIEPALPMSAFCGSHENGPKKYNDSDAN